MCSTLQTGLRHLYDEAMVDKLTKAAWAIKLNRGPDMLANASHIVWLLSVTNASRIRNAIGVELRFSKTSALRLVGKNIAKAKGKDIKETPTGYKGNRRDKDDGILQGSRNRLGIRSKVFPVLQTSWL